MQIGRKRLLLRVPIVLIANRLPCAALGLHLQEIAGVKSFAVQIVAWAANILVPKLQRLALAPCVLFHSPPSVVFLAGLVAVCLLPFCFSVGPISIIRLITASSFG